VSFTVSCITRSDFVNLKRGRLTSLDHQVSWLSAVVEDESPAVAEGDFFGLPGGALVEALGLIAGGVPFLVEPIEVRVFVRDPLLNGLPNHKERTVCWSLGGRWSRAAAMKSGALKISKLRLVVWWRLER